MNAILKFVPFQKRIRVESEEEEEAEGDGEDVEDDEDQEDEEDDDDSSLENNTEPSEPASEAPVAATPAAVAVPVPTEAPKPQNGVPPVISRPRMVGAPPTKVSILRAFSFCSLVTRFHRSGVVTFREYEYLAMPVISEIRRLPQPLGES